MNESAHDQDRIGDIPIYRWVPRPTLAWSYADPATGDHVHVITDAGGEFIRCPACGQLILHGQTCVCGTIMGGPQ